MNACALLVQVPMSFTFSFGNATDAWNHPSLKSPMPCSNGILCKKDNCPGVHPGEEGSKRLYFQGRTVKDPKTGKMVEQGPCVRLVGKNKQDVPGYYRRRTAKMSWPAWCAQEGIGSSPSRPFGASGAWGAAASGASASQSPMPEALIAWLLPCWTPPSSSSPVFSKSVSIDFLIKHMGFPESDRRSNEATQSVAGSDRRSNEATQSVAESEYTRVVLNKYLEVLDTGHADPTHFYADSLYLSVLSLSSRFPQDHPFQPSLRAADAILATRVFQARLAERVNAIGELIYAKAKTYLAEVEPAARANNAWAEGFNAGKATGIILEYLGANANGLEAEGHRLLNDNKAFEEMIADCLLVYKDSLVDLKNAYDSGC